MKRWTWEISVPLPLIPFYQFPIYSSNGSWYRCVHVSIYLYLCIYKPWHKGDYPKMYPTFLKIFIYDINCTTSLFFYLKISVFICIHLMGQNTHNRIYLQWINSDLCILKMVNYGTPLQYSCLENPMRRGAW